MPEPESNTLHASQHNAPRSDATTPERVRQVELNRLRGRYSTAPPNNLILYPLLFLVPSFDA